MSDIRLYIDEDAMDSVFVKAITSRGIDVVTAADENGEQMRRIVRLVAVKSAEDMRNTVEFLSNW